MCDYIYVYTHTHTHTYVCVCVCERERERERERGVITNPYACYKVNISYNSRLVPLRLGCAYSLYRGKRYEVTF